MRAAVFDRYGPPGVVEVAEIPRPVPGPHDVVVRVVAAAVTSADARIRGARFPRGFGIPARLVYGVRRPRHPVLGGAVSGVVVDVGSKVGTLVIGDEVAGMLGGRMGGHAEYVAVAAGRMVPKPPEISHDEAAGALFGGTTALHFLRDRVGPGRTVLVNGASGAVGTSAVALGRHLSATMTGVTSGRNAALVAELGAERVIDHTTTRVAELDETYDVVLDTVGSLSVAAGRRLLAEHGVLLLVAADLPQTLQAHGRVRAGVASDRPVACADVLALVAQGQLPVVIDQKLSLDDIVLAHERVDSGHKVGNIVVNP